MTAWYCTSSGRQARYGQGSQLQPGSRFGVGGPAWPHLSERTAMTKTTSRTTLRWQDISVGDEVTPLEIPITTTMIVADAIATRDFMPMRHDRDYAKQQGSPNLFMNILTTNGYCVRFLTDWAGPEAMVKKLSIRLGVPCFPDDPLRFTGSVTAKTEGTDRENFVEVTFKGSNSLGDHTSGTAILSLLDGAGA